MAKWEVTEEPEMITVAVEHYDKILEELAELLYSYVCKLENTPSDHSKDKTQLTPCLVNK